MACLRPTCRGSYAESSLSPSAWLKTQKALSGRWLSLAVGLGVLAGFLLIGQAWYLARIIDAVIFAEAGLEQVRPWLWTMLGIFFVRAVLCWASEQAAFRAAVRVKLQLRDLLYARIQDLGPVRIGRERTGDLANSLTDGVEALEAYYARFLPAISLTALVPLSILAFVLPADWLSALILLVTAPLIPLFMILIGKGAERLNQEQWRKLARLSAHFLDLVQGLTTLKLFNASRREAEVVARISDEYRQSTMAVLRVAFLSSLTLEFFATAGIAILAVSIGFRLFWGEMQFLPGFFVLLLAPEFYLPLRNMGTHYHARMDAIGAAGRILEILDTPGPLASARSRGAPDLGRSFIRFQGICFTYPGDRHALSGLDLRVRPRERIALVGPSGAGKSTVVNLLLGFVRPDAGEIRVDETPLDLIDMEDWRRQLAWVPQNPRLFYGTLLDNIRLGKPQATMEQVRAAVRLARADEFVERLPRDYETFVGEGGQGLSGGQVRRIALARAFLRDAPLVILDEATASLDPESERQVAAGIEALSRNRTMVIIAHRLKTVRNADRILVLKEGRIEEQGNHHELMRLNGLYRRMASGIGQME
jgi:ATP-binding cassette subfamily C protein CydD